MIVVDTNVVAYLMIEGERTDLAQQAYRLDAAWLVPKLWRHEFLNVLATFVRDGGAELNDAIGVWRKATQLLETHEYEPDMEKALQLAQERLISAYDAQFAALALESGAQLVTEDRRLLQAFPEIAQSLADFCASS